MFAGNHISVHLSHVRIAWECNNGGQLCPANLAALGPSMTATTILTTFCTAGFPSIYAAFIISLSIDQVCEVRAMFDTSWSLLMDNATDIHVFSNLALLDIVGGIRRHERTVLFLETQREEKMLEKSMMRLIGGIIKEIGGVRMIPSRSLLSISDIIRTTAPPRYSIGIFLLFVWNGASHESQSESKCRCNQLSFPCPHLHHQPCYPALLPRLVCRIQSSLLPMLSAVHY